MSDVTSVFFLSFFIVTAASAINTEWRSELAVSFSTIKSDLELILADPDKPRTVNMEYTKGAILHLSVLSISFPPNRHGPPAKSVQIHGKTKIKFQDGSTVEKSHVVFMDGSFLDSSDGRPLFPTSSDQEKTTYLVIKPNRLVEPKPADKTISYIPTTLLTKELHSKKEEMKKKRIRNNANAKDSINLGSSSTPLTYNFQNKILHLEKPLKGISLSRNDVQPDIFMDVWYHPRSKLYGSSSRSLKGIDAVRVYDEWCRQDQAQTNGRALEGPHELEYSDQFKSDFDVLPNQSRETSSNLMQIAVDKLESHLKAIRAAMQGGCDSNIGIYFFSVSYSEPILVTYYCDTGYMEMVDGFTFNVLTVSESGTKILKECYYLRYENNHPLEMNCRRDDDARPSRIRRRRQKLWLNDATPKWINTALLNVEMNLLKEVLIKNEKRWEKEPTIGTSTLDGTKLFAMELPNGEKDPSYVEVYADFSIRMYLKYIPFKKLNFHGAIFSVPGETRRITLENTLASLHFDSVRFSQSMYVLGSAYWTKKQLQENLSVVSELASTRCRARKTKIYSLKLVYHNQFALDGLYECAEQVFFFKGNFRGLLLSKRGQNIEILTERAITNFIYVVKDQLFIPEMKSFDDVYAISLPAMGGNYTETLKNFGSPEKKNLPRQTLVMFKSKEL